MKSLLIFATGATLISGCVTRPATPVALEITGIEAFEAPCGAVPAWTDAQLAALSSMSERARLDAIRARDAELRANGLCERRRADGAVNLKRGFNRAVRGE